MSAPAPARPIAVLALLFASATSPACGGDPPNERPSHAVAREAIERIVVATGTVEPAKEVEVRPRIAGIVQKIHVEAGDRVEAGQVLVEIERDLLEAQVREASARLDAARVEQRYARIQIERSGELHDAGAASNQAYDDAAARHEGAIAGVARARAAYDTLSTQLSYATVRSPLAGRVLDVHTEEGNAVSPVTAVTGGTLLLSLAGTDELHLEGLVDENEIARLEVGQAARIRTEAFGDTVFEGRLREIAPLGERVQNVTYFEVEVEIHDPAASKLRPRMSGDAEIITETVASALVVPETALHYRGDEIFVEVPNGDGSPSEQAVEIGIIDGDRVQIVSGLQAGATVLLQ